MSTAMRAFPSMPSHCRLPEGTIFRQPQGSRAEGPRFVKRQIREPRVTPKTAASEGLLYGGWVVSNRSPSHLKLDYKEMNGKAVGRTASKPWEYRKPVEGMRGVVVFEFSIELRKACGV